MNIRNLAILVLASASVMQGAENLKKKGKEAFPSQAQLAAAAQQEEEDAKREASGQSENHLQDLHNLRGVAAAKEHLDALARISAFHRGRAGSIARQRTMRFEQLGQQNLVGKEGDKEGDDGKKEAGQEQNH